MLTAWSNLHRRTVRGCKSSLCAALLAMLSHNAFGAEVSVLAARLNDAGGGRWSSLRGCVARRQ